MVSSKLSETLDNHGFAVIPGVIPADMIAQLGDVLERRASSNLERCLLELQEFAQFVNTRIGVFPTGEQCRSISATLIDQDVIIAAAARHNVTGYTAWSVKQGIVHVQPPVAILEKVIAVRGATSKAGSTKNVWGCSAANTRKNCWQRRRGKLS